MAKFIYVIVWVLILFPQLVSAQTTQQLKDSAATFSPMPRGTASLLPFVQNVPTFASGGPFNDLDFTLLDTDYMDGENSGSDVFMPVDPSDEFPGSNKVKYIRCILNTDLNLAYGSANADRIILGTHEIKTPFFLRGTDGIDNDYVVVQHLDYKSGAIQLKGSASDYSLIYCTLDDGCKTEGWYLFYTVDNQIDLIAFIYPCWDIEPSISGNPPNNPNPICNTDSTLSLTNPNHFIFAKPIDTMVAISNGFQQIGSNGKEIVGGMTVDNLGNTYLFGQTDGNMDGKNDAENELFIQKLDLNGNKLWVTELPLDEGSILKDGITDDIYLYVCGRTLGSLPGYTNNGRWDGIILKIDLENGQIRSTNQWGNAGIDGYGNIEQDDNGNIFVSAQGSPEGQGGTDDVYLVAKHLKSDLSVVWRTLNAPNASGFIASAEAWGGLTYVPSVNPGDGRLVTGGWYFGPRGANAFVSVYENLDKINPTRPYSVIIDTPGIRADWVFDNAVDSNGNIYVAGFTTGNLGSSAIGEGDAFVAKYSPELTNPIFKQFGTKKSDLIRKLLIQNDTLFTIGYTYGDFFENNADSSYQTGDIFIQKLDVNLNLLEGIQFGTPHEDRGYGFIKDSNLWVGGMTEGYMTGNNLGSFDGFITTLNAVTLSFSNPIITSLTNQNLRDEQTNWFKLAQNYPNPFNPSTNIQYTLSVPAFVRIEVHNSVGQLVATLVNKRQPSGHYNEYFRANNLTSGVYFYTLRAGSYSQTQRMILLK